MAAYEMWGNEEAVKADPINTLQKYYVKINTEADEHPEYAEAGREWFRKLEDGDEEAVRLWKWFRAESLKRFMKVYDMLDVNSTPTMVKPSTTTRWMKSCSCSTTSICCKESWCRHR